MDITGPTQTLQYEVHSVVADCEKYYRWHARRHLRDWLWYATYLVPPYAVLCAGTCIFAQFFGGTMTVESLVAAIAFGCILAPLAAVNQYHTQIKQSVSSQRCQSWRCELTDEFYQFTSSDGVRTCIPWRRIKIETEEPEYFAISCGSHENMIYRDPLRRAGLEEEFVRRVGAGSQAT